MAVADNLGLWTNDKGERVENGRKAKILIENGPIGVLGTGQPTSWLTIHRRLGGGVHGNPSAAPNETSEDTYNDNRSNKVR